MADNYVSIKIKASDTAKPDLTDLKLQLDELGAKVETAKVDVDDEDAAVKLLRMNAKLADLNAKVANPRIKVAGAARAEAEILALNHELDKMDRKAAEAGPTGLLGRILTGAEGAGGGAGEGGGGVAGLLPGGPALAGLGAAIPLIGALAVEVTGLVSGFAAAGAGAGAFGLLAMPAFKSVSGALTQVKADQTAYDRALTKTAKNNALKHLQEDYAKLDPAQRAAVKGIQQLSSTFGRISKAFEPQAFKVFNDALKIANDLLPALTPFANSFANALDGLLKHADKFTKSKGFQDWLKQFQSLVGPAVTAIGNGIGKVLPALGKLLTLMSKKDVVNAINIAFTVLAGTITVITAGISRFMKNWDGMSRAVTRDARDVAKSFDAMRHDIAAAFDNVRHGLADSAHSWAHSFDQMRHDIAAWAADVVRFGARVISWFRALPGRILGAIASLPGRMRSAGVNVIAGLLNGLVAEGGRVISYVEHLASNIISAFGNILHIFSPSKVFEQHGRMIAAGLIQGMDGSKGLVTAAAGRLARATLPGGYPGGASGRGGQVSIQIAPKGGSGLEAQFWTWLKNGVREQGGDPGMFQRKVAFR